MPEFKRQERKRQARIAAGSFSAMAVLLPALALAQAADGAGSTAPAAEQAPQRKVNVNEYIVRGNTVLDVRTIEKTVTPFLGPDRTLQDIEGARAALLAAYQAKGYQTVYVDLPEQQVTGGVVILQVSETRVGRVRVVGAEYTSPLAVRDQVPALQEGKVPDFSQAQTELTALNRANRQVMPVVRQGIVPGTMDVDLKVDDKSPWRASLGVNNDRSADTKPLRAIASIGHDNLWQLGHSASLSFFGAPQDFSQAKVWSAAYTAPIPSSNWSLELSGYKSDSNVSTLGGTSVLGNGHTVGLKATYVLPMAGTWWQSVGVGVDFKDNVERVRFGKETNNVPLKYAPLSLYYTGYRQGDSNTTSLNLSATMGTRSLFGYGSNEQAFDDKRYASRSSFMTFKADATNTYTFSGGAQAVARVAAQLADSPLMSSEQFAAGGMNSVRGYLSAETTGDYGALGSLEWRTAPFTVFPSVIEDLRLYLFTEAAYLRLRQAQVEQTDSFTLASAGFGTSFKLGQYVSARFDFGYPLRDGPQTRRHSPRLNFSVTANY
jgi:hemolysin activation/secretion protein